MTWKELKNIVNNMSEEQLSRTVCVSNNREVLIASDVFIDEDENTIIEAENHNPNFL